MSRTSVLSMAQALLARQRRAFFRTPYELIVAGAVGDRRVAEPQSVGRHDRRRRSGIALTRQDVDDDVGRMDTIGQRLEAGHRHRVLQADAFSGYARLYPPDRKPGPIVEALCWSHARRKFFELADIAANARRGKNAAPISPIALEAVKRIDAIFEIEREINGVTAEERLAARRSRSAPLVAALEEWTRSERAKLSRHNAVAKAIDYMLTRWPAFSRFLEDGRICLTNNAAERALRGLALGRKSWLFAGSERGAERAAIMYTLIQTAKLNDIDPQAWLADTLSKIAETPQTRLGKLLPWNWMSDRRSRAAA